MRKFNPTKAQFKVLCGMLGGKLEFQVLRDDGHTRKVSWMLNGEKVSVATVMTLQRRKWIKVNTIEGGDYAGMWKDAILTDAGSLATEIEQETWGNI